MTALLLIALGTGLILLPSLLVVALCAIASLRRDRDEGNSQPAADEVAPVVAGRAAIKGLVAVNDADRRAA